MADLIDRINLLQEMRKKEAFPGLPAAAQMCAMEFVTYAPAVDAVPVIRCRDCQFYSTIEVDHGIKYNICELYDATRNENDFCSYGEPVEKPVESVEK